MWVRVPVREGSYPVEVTEPAPPVSDAAYRLAWEVNARLGKFRGDISDPEAEAWWVGSDLTAQEIADWVNVGVRRPDRIPVGLTPADYSVMDLIRIEPFTQVWAGVGQACTRSVLTLRPVGKDPTEVVGLVLALLAVDGAASGVHGALRQCPTVCRVVGWCHRVMRDAAELDWTDLALCVRAGMGLDEAVEHMRAGRGMEPVRVLAALAGGPSNRGAS